MDRKLSDYLPFVIRNYAEFQAITESEQPEFERAWAYTDDLLDNQFVATAGEMGLSRWEQILGITPKGTDTLDNRRFAILARLNEQLPFTLRRLQELLEVLCGEGGCTVAITDYTLTTKVSLASKGHFTAVGELLERVTPQNLILRLVQLYNTHGELGRFTHGELAGFTHIQLREEVLKNGN